MKFSRRIFSETGIFVTIVLLLMFAAGLAIFGIGMEVHEQQLGHAPFITNGLSTLPTYVYQAMLGNIPSRAGTYQSLGLLIGWIVTPVVAAVMFAVKASMPAVDSDASVVYAS